MPAATLGAAVAILICRLLLPLPSHSSKSQGMAAPMDREPTYYFSFRAGFSQGWRL